MEEIVNKYFKGLLKVDYNENSGVHIFEGIDYTLGIKYEQNSIKGILYLNKGEIKIPLAVENRMYEEGDTNILDSLIVLLIKGLDSKVAKVLNILKLQDNITYSSISLIELDSRFHHYDLAVNLSTNLSLDIPPKFTLKEILTIISKAEQNQFKRSFKSNIQSFNTLFSYVERDIAPITTTKIMLNGIAEQLSSLLAVEPEEVKLIINAIASGKSKSISAFVKASS